MRVSVSEARCAGGRVGRGLACGAADDDGLDAIGNLMLHQLVIRIDVDPAILQERGLFGGRRAGASSAVGRPTRDLAPLGQRCHAP